tara:strand:+ start:150 stop:305 length:156 start_codon:yes stop_codon:yes gene_type:complete
MRFLQGVINNSIENIFIAHGMSIFCHWVKIDKKLMHRKIRWFTYIEDTELR